MFSSSLVEHALPKLNHRKFHRRVRRERREKIQMSKLKKSNHKEHPELNKCTHLTGQVKKYNNKFQSSKNQILNDSVSSPS